MKKGGPEAALLALPLSSGELCLETQRFGVQARMISVSALVPSSNLPRTWTLSLPSVQVELIGLWPRTFFLISRLNLMIEPLPPVICGIFATARVPKRPCLCLVMVTVVTIAPEIGFEK